MKRALPLALALMSFAAPVPAFAEDGGTEGDSRLVTLTYDEAQVFTIRGRVRVQTTIKFREDERIENVAIGDSKAWQVQPNKAQSILFVKPLEPSAATNMTVVTSKRTYLFDLIASPRNNPLYVMQFRYPEAEKAEREARLAAAAQEEAREEANALEMAAATDPYAVVDPALLNWEWTPDGDKDLLPERAYDDGEAMFLTWPAGEPIPAILVANERGDIGAVNFTVRGDTVVLDEVPSQIILRSGENAATLTNTGPARPRSAEAGARTGRGS
ncbi:TrbG/VirB9 family P-type conjugative transfer protein [Erythrobacter sp. HL-111]|uniref:TrbG/VirB9 family P-type conjugative transfer protein n=1 Tax=Erythrobacter sp. HL-111 TaxID=1798193 RepID=UPI0006DB0EED|nr:TrbG/VirB9 family P-type conjugative transfer protein [Erythrobacter sp. HL-111]KPP93934.1 MAG: type IV secretion system protein VirB9 [Erythrobacteraceae bacterium HL-111]SDS32793.1 type IV secretion system protein VirB9 [Erythrobacter sp. HL-111]